MHINGYTQSIGRVCEIQVWVYTTRGSGVTDTNVGVHNPWVGVTDTNMGVYSPWMDVTDTDMVCIIHGSGVTDTNMGVYNPWVGCDRHKYGCV